MGKSFFRIDFMMHQCLWTLHPMMRSNFDHVHVCVMLFIDLMQIFLLFLLVSFFYINLVLPSLCMNEQFSLFIFVFFHLFFVRVCTSLVIFFLIVTKNMYSKPRNIKYFLPFYVHVHTSMIYLFLLTYPGRFGKSNLNRTANGRSRIIWATNPHINETMR